MKWTIFPGFKIKNKCMNRLFPRLEWFANGCSTQEPIRYWYFGGLFENQPWQFWFIIFRISSGSSLRFRNTFTIAVGSFEAFDRKYENQNRKRWTENRMLPFLWRKNSRQQTLLTRKLFLWDSHRWAFSGPGHMTHNCDSKWIIHYESLSLQSADPWPE